MSKQRRIKREPEVSSNQSAFAAGSIARIKLENFLTYDSVEFRPGPSLNVIIGPNGTGKSTIVCAICLGLAGKPSLLGRALSPVEYIKHGCQRALIELELHNPDGENYLICREITKGSKACRWSINGRHATQRNVEVTVNALNIQVGNLCQFLPQDKVADFAKMTQQELLENTEKAVGPPEMFESHQELKTAREKERNLESSYQRGTEQLDHEKTLNSRLEQDVKSYQERQEHMSLICQLKAKRPWVEYKDKRGEHNDAQALRDAQADQLKKARKKHNPLQEKLDTASKKIREVDVKIQRLGESVKQQAKLATDCHKKIETQNDLIQEINDEFVARQQDEQQKRTKIRGLQNMIKTLENEMANIEDQEVQPRIEQVNGEMTELGRQIIQATQRIDGTKTQANALKQEVSTFQAELRGVQNIANRRLEELRKFSKDTYDAIQWLRANKQRFKGQIYEPLMLTMNVKDMRMAKYLENHISKNDMRAFVCERNDDMKQFMDVMRTEQNLRINVIVSPSDSLDRFKPAQPINNLSRYGFHSYMKDLFDCPELIMKYLCKNYGVHNIPVGSDYTKSNVETVIKRNPQMSTFYTDNHRYDIKKSRYSSATSSLCMELKNAHLLALNSDSAREQELRQDIETRNSDAKKLEAEWRELDKEQKNKERLMEKLRTEKKELMNKKNLRRQTQQKINMKTDALKRLESESLDLEAEEKVKQNKIWDILVKKCKMLKDLQKFTQKCLQFSKDKVRESLIYTTVFQHKSQMETDLQEGDHEIRTLERELEKQKILTRELKDAAKRLLDDAKKASNLPAHVNEIPNETKKVFELLPNSVAAIDAQIHEQQARADCTFQTDKRVVDEYKDRQKRIEELATTVESRDKELQNHREQIEKLKSQWIGPLQELITKINTNFSHFFACMQCAGEVDLNIPENPEDYEKYGVRIKVLFRASEQLRELTPTHQSGGERSVATVLYMMALQELTRVPFRCVDEINQGMDPQNERKVFELVVQTACSKSNSQYFLLTPKLLPDLEFTDKMTVLCVYNGPSMMNHTDFRLHKFIRRRKRFE